MKKSEMSPHPPLLAIINSAESYSVNHPHSGPVYPAPYSTQILVRFLPDSTIQSWVDRFNPKIFSSFSSSIHLIKTMGNEPNEKYQINYLQKKTTKNNITS